jgi:hypothetical protein
MAADKPRFTAVDTAGLPRNPAMPPVCEGAAAPRETLSCPLIVLTLTGEPVSGSLKLSTDVELADRAGPPVVGAVDVVETEGAAGDTDGAEGDTDGAEGDTDGAAGDTEGEATDGATDAATASEDVGVGLPI